MSFGDFVCLLEEETAKGAKEEAAETEEEAAQMSCVIQRLPVSIRCEGVRAVACVRGVASSAQLR